MLNYPLGFPPSYYLHPLECLFQVLEFLVSYFFKAWRKYFEIEMSFSWGTPNMVNMPFEDTMFLNVKVSPT